MNPPIFALDNHLAQRERLNDPVISIVHGLAECEAREQIAVAALAAARAETALFISTIPEDFREFADTARRGMKGKD